MLRLPALGPLGQLRSRRGDPGAAELLDEALAMAMPTGELQRIAPVAVARAEAAWLRGLAGRAADELRAIYPLALELSQPWVRGEIACWLWRVGALGEVPEGVAEPYALEIAGDWSGAAACWKALGCPFEEALARAGSGEPGAMREALSIFRRLGAGPAADHVTRELRALGVRDLPQGPRASTRANSAGLTVRQMTILQLVAEGLSNGEIAARLYISPKTVDHHVSAILSKLDARSRLEAAIHARRIGVLPG